jgi:hypothetical protein
MLKTFAKIRNDGWVEREFNNDDFFFIFRIHKAHLPQNELHSFESEL